MKALSALIQAWFKDELSKITVKKINEFLKREVISGIFSSNETYSGAALPVQPQLLRSTPPSSDLNTHADVAIKPASAPAHCADAPHLLTADLVDQLSPEQEEFFENIGGKSRMPASSTVYVPLRPGTSAATLSPQPPSFSSSSLLSRHLIFSSRPLHIPSPSIPTPSIPRL